ncbi:unnamed protein product [Prorocentrum cordatum]|uniref:Protein kinase domain-containing protein n=1 Tax=Prorocentrum cordatum TaxID=2364126 RepID=A0ABN9WJQ3_9DINO|nr:unnamed protein product [Polarella glacialis]
MGWSWAAALVQAANGELLPAGPQVARRWICNRRCAPAVAGREPAALLCIDNFASLGTVKETVQLDGDSMERQLRGRGLTTHDISGPQVDVDLLGFHIDGARGAIRIAPERFWRPVMSLDYILKHSLLTGAELERLIGHLTHVLLLRREVLSLLSASYVFVSKCYTRRVRLWPSVRRELTWMRALLPLAWADLRGAWAPSAMAVDASMTGLGAVGRSADPRDVGRVGRDRERWRFKEHELVAEGAVGDSPFPDVPSDFCKGEALLWAMRRQARAIAKRPRSTALPWHRLLGSSVSGLELEAVRPSTQQNYLKCLSGLCNWLGAETLPSWSALEWDDALLQYLNDEFARGARPNRAAKLLSAVLWARPALGRPLRVVLPRSSRALLGWMRKRPGHSRPPLSWLVLCGVLELLLLKREVAMACALCLMFHCHLRPGELLAMKAFQLVPPAARLQGGFRWWTLLLHPEELLVPSKTGELGDSLPLGAPELQWLTPALRNLKARLEPREPLWSFGYAQLREELENALAALGLQSLGATLRCRRYEKHGRLALQVAKVPPVVQERLRLSMQRLPQLFASCSTRRSTGCAWGEIGTGSKGPVCAVARRGQRRLKEPSTCTGLKLGQLVEHTAERAKSQPAAQEVRGHDGCAGAVYRRRLCRRSGLLLPALCGESSQRGSAIPAQQDAEGQCLGLELGSAARYSGQVLLALAHLHEAHHVVYRDMKPENVLLHLDSDSAKLADFGSAKFVGGSAGPKGAPSGEVSRDANIDVLSQGIGFTVGFEAEKARQRKSMKNETAWGGHRALPRCGPRSVHPRQHCFANVGGVRRLGRSLRPRARAASDWPVQVGAPEVQCSCRGGACALARLGVALRPRSALAAESSCGGLLFPLFGDAEQRGSQELRALLYLAALLYVFQGVAVVSDYFMSAVEVITSKKARVQTAQGRWVTSEQWNGTVANLTLLALGSSAPEILLSCIELMKDEGFSGKLGPSTIVGSAAFNLFVIVGVCIAAIPNPADHRAIAEMAVYHVTMIFSLFAYFWLWFIVAVSSADVVQPWEAGVALLMFPVLVFVSWLADKGHMPFIAMDPLPTVDDGTEHYLFKHARVRLSELHRVGTLEFERADRKTVKRWKESPQVDGDAVDDSILPYRDPSGRGIIDHATGKLLCSGCGILAFRSDVEQTTATCNSRHPFSVDVLRRNGTSGRVRCQFRTEGLSAIPAHDFIPKKGTLEFGPGEDIKKIIIEILGKRIGERDDTFQLVLSDIVTEDEVSDDGAHFNPYDDGGRDKAICTITIANGNEDKTTSLMERFIDVDNFKVGLEAWSEQIKIASSVEGDAGNEEEDEAEEAQRPSVKDLAIHVVTLPWKMLFALLCPPSNWCGGWLLFGMSLIYIGACTALVIDLASFFGCCAEISQEVTAVTIVALGTSLPDTFASVTAAQEDEHADASIVNVTGSNSVNVFLGIGLPWTIASIFWTTSWGATDEWKRAYPDMIGKHPDGAFVVKVAAGRTRRFGLRLLPGCDPGA